MFAFILHMSYALQIPPTIILLCFILFGAPDAQSVLTKDITDHDRQLIAEKNAKFTFR